jgi:hypothetical protein
MTSEDAGDDEYGANEVANDGTDLDLGVDGAGLPMFKLVARWPLTLAYISFEYLLGGIVAYLLALSPVGLSMAGMGARQARTKGVNGDVSKHSGASKRRIRVKSREVEGGRWGLFGW